MTGRQFALRRYITNSYCPGLSIVCSGAEIIPDKDDKAGLRNNVRYYWILGFTRTRFKGQLIQDDWCRYYLGNGKSNMSRTIAVGFGYVSAH